MSDISNDNKALRNKEYKNNKKNNKHNIRVGQRKKNSLIYPDEEEIDPNQLSSGSFDPNQNIKIDNEESISQDEDDLDSLKKENLNADLGNLGSLKDISKINVKKKLDIVEENSEYENYADDYFTPIQYTKSINKKI